MTRTILALVLLAAAASAFQTEPAPKKKVGYTDTPVLPGMKWRVHDPDRPQAPAVDPGTGSPGAQPGKPPSDAVVLFDGKDLSKWQTAEGQEPGWVLKDGVLEVPPPRTPNGGDIVTKESFGDCQFHIEWAAPDPPQGDLMNRGNSGVYFFGRYEVQIFDSFGGGIYADGQAASVYGQYPPLVNASRKPGEWQVYDILFTAPRFKDGQLVSPAFVTVLHNGVCVHNHLQIMGSTMHRALPKYVPHEPAGPIRLQAHGNPVRFRSIWARPIKGYDEP
jgi:hypothetical protein